LKTVHLKVSFTRNGFITDGCFIYPDGSLTFFWKVVGFVEFHKKQSHENALCTGLFPRPLIRFSCFAQQSAFRGLTIHGGQYDFGIHFLQKGRPA